jgi:hypothetical protein
LRLIGRGQNRDAIGARVTLRAGSATQLREVRAGHSYASASDLRLHFGLGERAVVDAIEVRWPDGSRTRHAKVSADRHVVLRQSEGH